MPLLDMPLEQLKNYQGRNPCPADMDKFWDNAIKEMNSLDPKVELTPHKLKTDTAEAFDMYFTGVGNSKVYAKFLKPKNKKPPYPALLIFHGYSGSSGDWYDKLTYASNGYVVAALDCRGQGGLSEDVGGVKGTTFNGHFIRGLEDANAPEKLLFRQIFLDTAELARIVMDMPEVDKSRVYSTGGSQGGALCLACGALEPRVSKIASVLPFLSDYQRVWEMDLAKGAYTELKNFFRSFDPMHKREKEIFTKLGYIDVQHLAKRIKGEVFMGTSLMDDICPPSTQFAIYNKIKSPKNMKIYPDFGHEFPLPGINDMIFEFFEK